MARLFVFWKFASIVDELEGFDVALEDDLKLLEQSLSGLLFLVQSNVFIATCIWGISWWLVDSWLIVNSCRRHAAWSFHHELSLFLCSGLIYCRNISMSLALEGRRWVSNRRAPSKAILEWTRCEFLLGSELIITQHRRAAPTILIQWLQHGTSDWWDYWPLGGLGWRFLGHRTAWLAGYGEILLSLTWAGLLPHF